VEKVLLKHHEGKIRVNPGFKMEVSNDMVEEYFKENNL